MNVTQDLSIVGLIVNASVLVQLVMAMLLLASLFSWYYIFRKQYALRRAQRETDAFEREFWSGGNLNEL
jgi:biopolymer transport protein TolQ